MRKHHLTTAIASALEFIQNLGFRRIWNRGPIKVGALAVSIPLLLLESSLEVKPLICQHLATIHTSYGNDHPYTW